MGPRKGNAFANGKDDGAAAGKLRKVGAAGASAIANAAGGGAISGSSSHKANTTAASGTALTTDISYTSEERAFLESQLALFPGSTTNGSGSPPPTVCTDFSKMTREQWFTGLPLLVSATEKLLQVAAEQYRQTCRDRAAAALAAASTVSGGGAATGAAAVGGGGGATGPNGVDGKHGSIIGSSSINSATGPDGTVGATAAASTSVPRPTPAAGTPAQFSEENAYIVAQAQQLQWYPFTYQRWVELLLEPGRYHTARDDGRLRGDAIQMSLRRCILVTYPAVEGGDVM